MRGIIKCCVIDSIENVFVTRCEGVTDQVVVEGKIGQIYIDSDVEGGTNGVKLL